MDNWQTPVHHVVIWVNVFIQTVNNTNHLMGDTPVRTETRYCRECNQNVDAVFSWFGWECPQCENNLN